MNISVKPHMDTTSKSSDVNQLPMDLKLRNSTPKGLKDLDAFDLSSLNSLLPPNTGPPGTVNVSSTGPNSNKNLSHVPCKFFRQGICQAGASCPFSHNLDGTLGADALPCKYFQKGNCKFGLKCALAHFLPDGTRINSKSFMNSLREKKNNNHNGHSNHFLNGSINLSSKSQTNHNSGPRGGFTNSAPYNGFHSDPIDIGSYNQTITPPNKPVANFMSFPSKPRFNSTDSSATMKPKISNSVTSSNSHHIPLTVDTDSNSFHSVPNYTSNTFSTSHSSSTFGFSNNNSGPNTANSAVTPTSLLTSSNSQPNSARGGLFRSYSSTSPTAIVTNQSTSPQSNFFNQQQLISHSPTNMSLNGGGNIASFSRSFTSHNKFYSGSFSSYLNALEIHESAIIDDDEQGKGIFYEEDYVPASLGDIILTPQEMQGRDSRSQSGTLFARPNLSSTDDDQDKSIISQEQETSQTEIDNDNDNSFQKLGNDVVFLME